MIEDQGCCEQRWSQSDESLCQSYASVCLINAADGPATRGGIATAASAHRILVAVSVEDVCYDTDKPPWLSASLLMFVSPNLNAKGVLHDSLGFQSQEMS